MKVTIVTPVFNGADYIRETIDSIARQTWHDIEHIVVDGGSTDGTPDIVREYEHVRLIEGPDDGMYDAINKGFAEATGSIFAYLNADDAYYPDAVERAVRAFTDNGKIKCVFSNVAMTAPDGSVMYTYRYFSTVNFSLLSSQPWSMVPQPTSFWRADLYRAVGGFDKSFRVIGDFDFFLKIAQRTPIHNLGRPTARFRVLDTSLTATQGEVIARELQVIYNRYGIRPSLGRDLRRRWVWLRLQLMNLDNLFARRRTQAG